ASVGEGVSVSGDGAGAASLGAGSGAVDGSFGVFAQSWPSGGATIARTSARPAILKKRISLMPPKRQRQRTGCLGRAGGRSLSVTALSRADRLQPFLQPVGQRRHAEQVLRRAAIGPLARGGKRVCPFRGVVVAAAYPGQRHQFG